MRKEDNCYFAGGLPLGYRKEASTPSFRFVSRRYSSDRDEQTDRRQNILALMKTAEQTQMIFQEFSCVIVFYNDFSKDTIKNAICKQGSYLVENCQKYDHVLLACWYQIWYYDRAFDKG